MPCMNKRRKPESSRKVKVVWGKKTSISFIRDLAKETGREPAKNERSERILNRVADTLEKNMSDSKDKVIIKRTKGVK